jgi:cell division protein FtsB
MGFGFKIALLTLVLLLASLGAFYWYYNDTQVRVQALMDEKARLTVQVAEQKQAIDTLQTHAAAQAQQVTELQQGLNEATQARRDLENKFNNRDIAQWGRQDAQQLEDHMNAATQRVFQDLEKTTGAKPSNKPLPAPSKAQVKHAPKKPGAVEPFKQLDGVNAQ